MSDSEDDSHIKRSRAMSARHEEDIEMKSAGGAASNPAPPISIVAAAQQVVISAPVSSTTIAVTQLDVDMKDE